MLNRLPPRVHLLLRQYFALVVGGLATAGIIAIYQGHVVLPPYIWIAAAFIGSTLAVIFRDVPSELMKSRKNAGAEKWQ